MKKKVFITIESLIFAAFMIIDLVSLPFSSIWIKYCGILICLIYTAGNNPVFPALIFTAAADYFLLVSDSYYEVGVGLFIIAQLIHMLRVKRQTDRYYILFRILVPVILTVILLISGYASPLFILVAIYFPQLVINAIGARGIYKIGLLLFICCDICVGLFNILDPYSPAFRFVSIGMWMFYLPSQVIIALSSTGEYNCEQYDY